MGIIGSIGDAASSAVSSAAHVVDSGVDAVSPALGDVGEWAWKNKADIGFWAGTAALTAAIPLTGGASGAALGGIWAARAASVGIKVAQMGRTGSAAVKAARAGAAAVQGMRGAMGGTRAAGAITRGSHAVHDARVALGATKAGATMQRAQKPLIAASTTLGGANLAETIAKYQRGKASLSDLGLAGLAVAPGVGAGVKSLAARRAASANAKAAATVAGRLDTVADRTIDATQRAKAVAATAPAAAPRTAGAARVAGDEAESAADAARRLQVRAARTTRAATADDAISATRLTKELDRVAGQAKAARGHAADAEHFAGGGDFAAAARGARHDLDEAARVAGETKDGIQRLAGAQRRADKVASSADKAISTTGSASFHANLANNATKTIENYGTRKADRSARSLGSSIGGFLLQATSRSRAAPAR